MTIMATLYKVTCHFNYQKENDTSTWHCATLNGAHRFVESKIENGLDWYSIEGEDFIPCDESDPGGFLYIGMKHFEFNEINKGEKI